MFEPRHAFSLPTAMPAGHFVAAWERPGFRPWLDDAGTGDVGDATRSAVVDATEQLRADAFAAGMAQGEALAVDTVASATLDAIARIAAAADRFTPCCDASIAALLAEAVTRLLADMFQADVARPDHLQRRAAQLASMIGDEVDPVCVRLHPADVAALGEARLAWPIVPDETLARGEIRLETRDGGIADNPADRIERLRRRIAGEATP